MIDWTFRMHRLRRGRPAAGGPWPPGRLAAAAALLGLALAACAAKVEQPVMQPQAEAPAEAEQVEVPPAEGGEAEAEVAEPLQAEPPPAERVELTGPGEAGRRKVGLLLPLSGQHGGLGEALLQAAELALFDAADEDFTLVVRDTEATPAGAREAARGVIDAGAELILGPLFASSVEAVTPLAQAAAVSVVAFSNDVSVAQPGVYVIGLLPAPQVERVVGYAAARGLQRFAALAPRTPYGRAVVEAMRAALDGAATARLERVVFYDPTAEDLAPEVKDLGDYAARQERLRARRRELRARDDEAAKLALQRLEGRETLGAPGFEAVMLPASGKRLLALAPLLAYYDIDPKQVRFLGTAQWNDPSLGTEPALVGGWFAAPPPASWREFAGRYERAFGAEPPRVAALAYDATALAAVLDRRFGGQAAGGRPFSVERLTQASGFVGVDGVFRLLDGGAVQRRLAVVELRRNALEVLDPAPTSFRSLTN